MATSLLMSEERTRRTLTRLAYEIVERNRGSADVELFGVLRRGIPLAEKLAATIREIDGGSPPVHPLDVTPFRDDIEDRPAVIPLDPAPSVQNRSAVIVDDVLFTGRTARAAIDAVLHYGRPASIQLVVLIDRGHRELPIRPDFVGRVVPTKLRERVVVSVDGPFEVRLED